MNWLASTSDHDADGRTHRSTGSVYTFRPRIPSAYLKGQESNSDSSSSEDGPGTSSTAQRTRRFREDPATKLRRLKLECLELQRQLELDAQSGDAQVDQKIVIDQEKDDEAGSGPVAKKTRAKKPDTQALLAQLLELRTGLHRTEQSSVLRTGDTGLDSKKLKVREEASKSLLDGLGARPAVSENGNGGASQTIKVGPSTQGQAKDVHVVSELDKRLDSLEKRIGAGVDTASAVSFRRQRQSASFRILTPCLVRFSPYRSCPR